MPSYDYEWVATTAREVHRQREAKRQRRSRLRGWLTVAGLLAAVVVVIAAMVACSSPTPSPLTSGSAPTPTAAAPTLAPTVAATPPTVAPVVAVAAVGPVFVKPLDANEGMIHITQRVCGSSRTWVAQANANHVTPPNWIVLTEQRLDIDCSRAPVAAPAPVVAQQAPRQATAEWLNPLPGTCRPSSGGGQFGAPRSGYRHQGIDLGGIEGLPVGTPVRAAHAGTVVSRAYAGNAGNQLQIRDRSILMKYNHLSGFAVGMGQTVAAGQVIGYMGKTGNATGPHLHVELWRSGQLVDPTTVLPVRC